MFLLHCCAEAPLFGWLEQSRTRAIKDTADLLASLLTLSRFVWLNLAEAPEKEPPRASHPSVSQRD